MFHIQLPTKENKYSSAWLCISFTKSALNSDKPLVVSGKNGLESNFPYILVLDSVFHFQQKKMETKHKILTLTKSNPDLSKEKLFDVKSIFRISIEM